MSQFENIKYERLIGRDLYTTFKGQYMGIPVVIKFFTEVSDNNNEYEILEYLHKYNGFPKPYFQVTIDNKSVVINTDMKIDNVYKVIVYEYIEGIPIDRKEFDKKKVIYDIQKQLLKIHKLGLVYGDIKKDNILKLPDGTYCLIDFGRTFSIIDIKFPPMKYMLEDNEVPSQKDDLIQLNLL